LGVRLARVEISSLMTRDVASVAPGATLADVVANLRDRRISCVLVCEGRVPVGIITERDLVSLAGVGHDGAPCPYSARDLMSAPVTSVPETAGLDEALALARRHQVRHLPVVDDRGRLAGIVTQTDLLDAYVAHVEALVRVRTEELAVANRKLEELSRRDGLLEIGNRRALEEALLRIHDAALRYGRPYSVALFDVDYFKQYNDRYGYVAGDETLRGVARAIAATTRAADSVYRYGGEELIVVFPETNVERAVLAAERMAESVRQLAIAHGESPLGHVTVSAGVGGIAGREGAPRDWRAFMARVDGALYRAKQSGRDRVVQT